MPSTDVNPAYLMNQRIWRLLNAEDFKKYDGTDVKQTQCTFPEFRWSFVSSFGTREGKDGSYDCNEVCV
jgi:hypothetical protein